MSPSCVLRLLLCMYARKGVDASVIACVTEVERPRSAGSLEQPLTLSSHPRRGKEVGGERGRGRPRCDRYSRVHNS